MESTLSTTSTTISAISKTLNANSTTLISHLHRHYSTTRSSQSIIRSQLAFLRLRRTLTSGFHRPSNFNSVSPSSIRGLTAASVPIPPVWCRLGCFSSSAASFASGGGGGGGISGGDGGGGDGAANGGEARVNAVPGGADDVSALSSDVIILDVGGMSCGGCAASVKRILESQPQVSSASVNLTTETAIVWPISEAKVAPNWQKNLGDELAKHLTTCGFKSNPRGEATTEGETLS